MPFTFSRPAIVLLLEEKWNKYFGFTHKSGKSVILFEGLRENIEILN
ncbi:DUF4184 family protein [Clostridium sp. Marseille-Q2269]|nr:DUF4184 family protein [Clostridium sp. Marseille-Q2269]